MTWHLVTTEFPPMIGGISTWTAEVAKALHAAGEPVAVHARAGVELPEPMPFPVYRMRGRWWGRWSGLWALLSVWPRVRHGDRVLCATWPLAEHLSRWLRVGVAFHGSDLTRPERRGQAGRRAAVIGRAAARLPVSRFLGELLRQPYTVLPYPILPVAPVARGEALLCVARLGPLKGVDRVLRLGARLGREVRVVGEGPERSALERLAASLGGRARFYGALRPEQIPWEGSAALMLLSRTEADGSGAEGLGLVLLEAAARGLPGIGCRTGGIPEAAMMVLEDPERDGLTMMSGALPEVNEVQTWLKKTYSPESCVTILQKVMPLAVNRI